VIPGLQAPSASNTKPALMDIRNSRGGDWMRWQQAARIGMKRKIKRRTANRQRRPGVGSERRSPALLSDRPRMQA
jgi:hypothetical protein